MKKRPRGPYAGPDYPKEPPERSEDGVDSTLIHWMLSLTPTQRLRTLQECIRSIGRLRLGKRDT
jgi:hypothetical protein